MKQELKIEEQVLEIKHTILPAPEPIVNPKTNAS